MSFAPIAIVGRGCVLPGALDPEQLWKAVLDGRDLLSAAPPGRWGIRPERILEGKVSRGEDAKDHTWSDRGGYVDGFDATFDASSFGVPADRLVGLDPLVHWVLQTARAALAESKEPPLARTGLVLGNLSYPSSSFARFAESVWRSDPEAPAADARNRFQSGLPAHLAAEALGLGGEAFALDAACASSLYAIKLACDKLHDGSADLMLAGGVNRADDLFLHVGFCALQALSRSGRSRPFHREADGLLPAEGAAFVALRRLQDAEAAGDAILGVIRGVGLSNDGRGGGFLAPAAAGQERAMRAAYAMAGLSPADVSLVECHATGTAVGDATEIESMSRVFAGREGVPIGSLKSNLGHLITVAGVAGLLKVLGALRAGVRPPTLHAEAPLPLLAGSPFRLLAAAEPWESKGPRRAAVSGFGFGGNNAHLLVEEYRPAPARAVVAAPLSDDPVAIVGLGARVADGTSVPDFARALFAGVSRLRPRESGVASGHADTVAVGAAGLRFPPRDLEQALPQQLLVLEAAREAVREAGSLPAQTTSSLVGMQCDPEVARYGARWRLAEWIPDADPGALDRARDAVCPPLTAAGVVGAMPNIPANRLNSQFDFHGPSFTVSSEERSGIVALQLAARALRAGEIDAAVVGAVDVCAEPVHEAAASTLGPQPQPAGDAAVVLVLRRLADARREGQPVYALLGLDAAVGGRALRLGTEEGAWSLVPLFGQAHAASGLLHVAAAALACRHRARPRDAAPAAPWLASGPRSAQVTVRALGGQRGAIRLVEDEASAPVPLLLEAPPSFHVYSGEGRRDVLDALVSGRESGSGPARLVIVAGDEAERREREARARRFLEGAEGTPAPAGIAYRERPLEGEMAFVFTGPAGTYREAGRDLLLAFPSLTDAVARTFSRLPEAAAWLYDGAPAEPLPAQKLWGSSVLCQIHAQLSRNVLGLRPQAAIGFCSGETNALFALGAWDDVDGLYQGIEDLGIYTRELSGTFDAVRRAWGEAGPVRWTSFRLLAPLDRVRQALAGEARAHLTIVNAPGDCVIGGDPSACDRVVERIGRERARPLGYDIAVHCPEMSAFRDEWRRLHSRPTKPVPGIRFYTHATLTHYAPTRETAAEALLGQASGTVDFPRLIENAWADGVRVFLEHGPQGGCSRWISRILGDRPHLAVALDVPEQSAVRQVAAAVAHLVAAGVPVATDALTRHFESATRRAHDEGPVLRFPAHRPEPVLARPAKAQRPAVAATSRTRGGAPSGRTIPDPEVQIMAPAPWLPPVLGEPVNTTRGAAAREEPGSASARVAADSNGQPGAPGLAAAPTQAPRPAPGPLVGIVSRLVEQQARVAAIHREFLDEQARLHQRFLGLQARMPAAEIAGRPGPRVLPAGQASSAKLVPSNPIPAAVEPPPEAREASGPAPAPFPGPALTRAQLEVLASGRISSVFGPLFEKQDGFRRQVRMPEPPLLLADRVLGIRGEPGSMGQGIIWTETDVRADSWYLHQGRMPAGIVIESGQADLLLISWLGVDFLNRGERVYRLLGCELTYHGGLPQPGETLRYEIHVDGHARQGEVRLFFFHYDCQSAAGPRLTVRHGQAGFFTDAELSASGGVLWDAETGEHASQGRLDPPRHPVRSRYSAAEVRAFAAGRVREAFGPGFERAETHVRTPRIAAEKMQLLEEVTHLDPGGGPWKRGYLRAVRPLRADDWFLEGHFKNDPCMPGTLMFEGCLQAMAFYLTAFGLTLDRDGWRFEPVPEETYRLRCRGQASPESRELTYEIFVEEVIDGPEPTLYADLLCTVDGLKAFHCRRMGLRLVPDWPLATLAREDEETRLALARPDDTLGVASAGGVRFGFPALLACAWGRPSEAFGGLYDAFDGVRRLPRLPGPPFHFMTRVTDLRGRLGVVEPGAEVEVEYDVPPEAWYFGESGHRTMPFAVLLEANLQPCGWLALATGLPATTPEDLYFRNLDGSTTFSREVFPDCGTLVTRVKLTGLSRSGGMFLLSFEIECRAKGGPLLHHMKTGFGFFPKKALAQQVGLPTSETDRAFFERPSEAVIDLSSLRARRDGPRLPGDRLLMFDRVTGYWPTAGRAGLGRLRAEKDIRASEWFFKAHFFQDPVQPGSLGLEAMLQLLRVSLLARGLDRGVSRPRFEAISSGRPVVWKYRGQVVPENERVTVELEWVAAGEDERGPYAVAEAWLWVDGRRIYHATGLGMRVVSD